MENRRKLEVPMEAAMPCKMGTKMRSKKSRVTDDETKGSNTIPKTGHACIVAAHGSTRQRLESTLPKDHENHIAEKGFNSTSHKHLVHKFIPMPQAMKIPDAESRSGQRMGDVRKVAMLFPTVNCPHLESGHRFHHCPCR